ncbi:MAG: hypothetical protein ACOCVS_02140 [Planctomycetota bacterium]
MTTAADTQALACAQAAREAHGPVDLHILRQIIDDHRFIAHPVHVVFDERALGPGDLAFVHPRGQQPEDGFVISLHPTLRGRPDDCCLVLAYQLVLINWGPDATAQTAEIFAATLLTRPRETVYQQMCNLADGLAETPKR